MGPDALKRIGTKYGTITDHRRKKNEETWVRFKVKKKKKEKGKRQKREMASEPVTKVDLSLLTTC